MIKQYEKIIVRKISNYIGFDVDELIFDHNCIFGGAIRDSISGDKINDVDILCLSKSMRVIENILIHYGYNYMDKLINSGFVEMYKDIKVIFEPHTWVKDNSIIQLIRPSLKVESAYNLRASNIEALNDILYNVDLSCCGVFYNVNGLQESVNNSILHCKHKVFDVLKRNKMYNINRAYQRISKLEDRGWDSLQFKNSEEIDDIFKNDIRYKKLKHILNK